MKSFLPKEFDFAHEFAFFHHDLLIQIIKEGEQSKIFNTEFAWKDEKHFDEFKQRGDDEFWEFFEEKGYHVELLFSIAKQIAVAVLSDFCHFTYMALKSADAAKLTVAYALLRKPLKENLFVLEWLLADPGDFLIHFYFDKPKTYDPTSISKERRKEIIKEAVLKTSSLTIHDSDLIFSLRYDKKFDIGFEVAFNQATHIVTNVESYKTENQNLNFVFSGEEEIYTQWNHLYSFAPYLLYYAYEVVDALINSFTSRDPYEQKITDARRFAGLILWADEYGFGDKIQINKNFQDLISNLSLICSKCKSRGHISSKRLAKKFYRFGTLICQNCRSKILS